MTKGGAWALVIIGGVLAGGSLLAAVASFSVCPLLATAIGGVLLFLGVKHLMAASVFEVAELVVKAPVAMGGTAELTLELVPKKPLSLVAADCVMTWKTVEEAEYSAGTRSRTYRNTVKELKVPLELPTELHHPLQQHLTITVPLEVPPSWKGRWNSLTSRVAVTVGIAKWPDLTLEREVTVLPEVHGG